MGSWEGRVALITGGASGIGRALSVELARRGASVVATDVDDAGGESLAASMAPKVRFLRLDVRDAEAFHAVAANARSQTGEIDLLVNNAGIGGASGEAHRLALSHWKPVLDVNLFGVIHGIHAVYPRMVERRSGQIVNVASLAGLGTAPFLLPYATSKAAVVGLSRTLRVEAAMHGVRVSAVCPAAIETPILDGHAPADLPDTGWRPDVRRYLTSLAGPPYPVEKFAHEVVDAIERNEPVIVIPARARLAWRLGRWLPDLVEKVITDKARRERALR